MKQKGFTMVELIAMLVVIGILMAITIPNISGILKNNREGIAIEDINKMVGNAEQKMETGSAKHPGLNQCVVMSLKYIDDNSDFKTGVNSGVYDREESFVVVTKKRLSGSTDTSEYKYYLRLVEKKTETEIYVIQLVDFDVFTKEPEKHNGKLTNFDDSQKINLATNSLDGVKNKINSMQAGLCDSVTNIYNE